MFPIEETIFGFIQEPTLPPDLPKGPIAITR